MSAVNPAAGKLVRMLGYLRYATGPLVVVMGAAAAAVKLVTDEQDRLKRISEENTIVAEGLAASNLKLQASLEDLAVATGDLTAEEMELLRARRQTFTESLPAIQKTAAALFEQKNRTRELTEEIADLEEKSEGAGAAMAGEFGGALSRSSVGTLNLTSQLKKARAELVESERRTVSLTEAQETQMGNIKETVEAIELRIAAEQRGYHRDQRTSRGRQASRAGGNPARCLSRVLHGHPERAVGNHQQRSQRRYRRGDCQHGAGHLRD